MPESWSLSKPKRDENGKQISSSHFQLFMKRLRLELGNKKSSLYRPNPEDRKIKYFMCGEYGNVCRHGFNLEKQECPLCNVGRPHYHACLFNMSFDDLETYASRDDGKSRFTSKKLESIWKYGFVDVGELTYESAGYVARYCLKKVNGDRAEDHYQRTTETGEIIKLEQEFAAMSNGVGKGFYEKYRDDMFPSDEVPVPGQGVFKKVPRYYMEQEEQRNPEVVEEIKEKRKAYKDSKPEEFEDQRLYSKYVVKKAQLGFLRRNQN